MDSSPQIQCSAAVNVGSFVSTKLGPNRNWNNYKTWKEQMLCLVQSQGLVGFIDGNSNAPQPQSDAVAAWRQTDWLLKGWILGALSDEVLQNVVNLDTARDVWLELENKFSQSERAPPPQPPPPPPLPRQPRYSQVPPSPPQPMPWYLPPPPPPPPPPPGADQEKEWDEYLPLYRAATSGDWDTAKQIVEEDPGAIRARLAYTLETALHVAVGLENSTRFVSKLVDLMSDEELAKTDWNGQNALHSAALTGNLEAAKILVNRLPDLLYVPSHVKLFPIHLAANFGHRQILEFLISQTKHDMPTDPFHGFAGVQLLTFMIDASFFDMALDLVHKCPHLASVKAPLPLTALSTMPLESRITALSRMALEDSAISQLNWWERLVYPWIKVEVEVEVEMQSFDIENQTCCNILVPFIKRVHQKKLRRQQALRLVKCLCKHMQLLKHEETVAIYEEAVLIAARSGFHEVIEIIAGTFPQAIYCHDTATRQNFLHLAVINRCETVFNLVYQTSNHRYHYINSLDSSGNTILHLAARLSPSHKLNLVSGPALQMQREIQWFKEVDKFLNPFYRRAANKDGKTAEMIFTEEHKELKTEGEKWMKDTANSCTIAAALIATVVFAAAITVPGGNESSSGYPIFSQASAAFTIFAVSDAISLFTSTTSLLMFLSILTSRYAEQDFLYALPKRLCIGLFTLFLSILFMVAAFASTVYLVFGRRNAWVLMAVGALACLPISSFVLLQFPLLFDVVSSTYGRGIFGKQSDRPFP